MLLSLAVYLYFSLPRDNHPPIQDLEFGGVF